VYIDLHAYTPLSQPERDYGQLNHPPKHAHQLLAAQHHSIVSPFPPIPIRMGQKSFLSKYTPRKMHKKGVSAKETYMCKVRIVYKLILNIGLTIS